jgi:hypothetical protein
MPADQLCLLRPKDPVTRHDAMGLPPAQEGQKKATHSHTYPSGFTLFCSGDLVPLLCGRCGMPAKEKKNENAECGTCGLTFHRTNHAHATGHPAVAHA